MDTDMDQKRERSLDHGNLESLDIKIHKQLLLQRGTSAAPSSAPNDPLFPHLSKLQTERANISKTRSLLQLSSC